LGKNRALEKYVHNFIPQQRRGGIRITKKKERRKTSTVKSSRGGGGKEEKGGNIPQTGEKPGGIVERKGIQGGEKNMYGGIMPPGEGKGGTKGNGKKSTFTTKKRGGGGGNTGVRVEI